jgi:hypothetical protein
LKTVYGTCREKPFVNVIAYPDGSVKIEYLDGLEETFKLLEEPEIIFQIPKFPLKNK